MITEFRTDETQTKWTSVDDRMPKGDVLVLGWDGESYWLALWDGNAWHDDWYDDILPTITHWMPLPEPPSVD